MAKRKGKKEYKVGDTITTYIVRSTRKKVKVSGKIKSIKFTRGEKRGFKDYTITDGFVEDFVTRTIS